MWIDKDDKVLLLLRRRRVVSSLLKPYARSASIADKICGYLRISGSILDFSLRASGFLRVWCVSLVQDGVSESKEEIVTLKQMVCDLEVGRILTAAARDGASWLLQVRTVVFEAKRESQRYRSRNADLILLCLRCYVVYMTRGRTL